MSQNNLAGLDTTLREFESGGFGTSVRKCTSWITVRGRGGRLMMSVDEVDDVVAVLRCAQDYVRDQQSDREIPPSPGEQLT